MIESAIAIVAFCIAVYGIYLSFKSSILLGFIALLITPIGLIVGLAQLLLNRNLAQEFVGWVLRSGERE
jgi:hypothetical protein